VPTSRPPSSLTVLYDATCPLCRWVRGWLEPSGQLVPLLWVACGSVQARSLLPGLDHDRTREEVTVISDTGDVWCAEAAWIMCLWATAEHRSLACWLAHPRRRGTACAVALAVAARMQGSAPAVPPGCTAPSSCSAGSGDAWVASAP